MDNEQKKNIKNLVKINIDAHEGYKTAAENTNDSLLSTFFSQCSKDRKKYAVDLSKQAGIESEKIDTDLKADLHRAWIDLKTSSQKFNAKDVLKECERGEKHAMEAYDAVIENKAYPASLEDQLKLQQEDIHAKYEHIQKLKKQFDHTDDIRNKQTPVP